MEFNEQSIICVELNISFACTNETSCQSSLNGPLREGSAEFLMSATFLFHYTGT